MANKSSLYTKMGDNGETGLVGGTRVSKADARIDLYGEVDELNSWVGIAITQLSSEKFQEEINYLQKVQCYLFDLGSNLACEAEQRENFKLPKLSEEVITELENKIDVLDSQCPKLKNFILPGGSRASSSLHLCRTVCRKIERKMIQFRLQHQEELPIHAAPFMNRLSDFFFVLSRYVNVKEGVEEVPWKPQV
jgi:cob(I)alamin adenosyltransferase